MLMPVKSDDLLPFFGTKANLARFLGVSSEAVYHWDNKIIPDKYKFRLISYFIGQPNSEDYTDIIAALLDKEFSKKKLNLRRAQKDSR